jgi:hypothetical protein
MDDRLDRGLDEGVIDGDREHQLGHRASRLFLTSSIRRSA